MLIAAVVLTLSAYAQNYSIDWSAIDGGGGTSTGGMYIVLCVDSAKDFHPRKHVQKPVQPTAIRYGINVPANGSTFSDLPCNVNQVLPAASS